eukprot:9232024-Alexandrium_andersonii.AAC.1
MSASLVGSEMCIRDSPRSLRPAGGGGPAGRVGRLALRAAAPAGAGRGACLLYTSDAADDM